MESGYYSPNRNYTRKPSLTTEQTPPLTYVIRTGAFKLAVNQPQWLEVGTSGTFNCYFESLTDGPIPFTNPPNNTSFVAPALEVLDGNGNTVSSITIQTPQADPGLLGDFFSGVQLPSTLSPGFYEAHWTAKYQAQPINGVAQPELPIDVKRVFLVQLTTKPSQYFLVDSRKI